MKQPKVKLAVSIEEVEKLNTPFSKYIDLNWGYQLICHNTESEYRCWFEDERGRIDWFLS